MTTVFMMKNFGIWLMICAFFLPSLAAEDLKVAVYAGNSAAPDCAANWLALLNQVDGISAHPIAANDISAEKLKEYHVFFMADIPRKSAGELRVIYGFIPELRNYQQNGGLLVATEPGYLKRYVSAMLPEVKIISDPKQPADEIIRHYNELAKNK